VSERFYHVVFKQNPKGQSQPTQPFPSLPILGSRESHPICGRKTRAKKPKR
jgi:hypothetical protein